MGEDEVCKAHSGIVEAVNDMKKKVEKIDGRLCGLVVLALVQLMGIAASLTVLDNFTLYARGTGGEYNILNQLMSTNTGGSLNLLGVGK